MASSRWTRQDPFTVTDNNGQSIQHHHQHFRKRDRADADSWPERVLGLSTFRERCLLDLPLIPGDVTRALGKGILPGSLYILEDNRRDLDRKYRIQHRLQRSKQRECFARISDFNRPHRLTVSYVYDLPFFANTSGLVHGVLGGWRISGETIFQSGVPFSIFDSGAALPSWARAALLC